MGTTKIQICFPYQRFQNPPQSRSGLPGAGIGTASEDRREDAALADEIGKEIIADYLCGVTSLTISYAVIFDLQGIILPKEHLNVFLMKWGLSKKMICFNN